MRKAAKALSIVLFCLVGAACGDDLTFPELPAELSAEFCVRGEATVGETLTGSLTNDDCDSADIDPEDEGYYEVWRIRVAETTTVIFDADSDFDNLLTVLRLDSFDETSAELTIIDANDDRAQGNLNALVEVTLQPDTDYILAVGGYGYGETGPYTVEIR